MTDEQASDKPQSVEEDVIVADEAITENSIEELDVDMTISDASNVDEIIQEVPQEDDEDDKIDNVNEGDTVVPTEPQVVE